MRPPKFPGREPPSSRLQIADCRFQKGTRNLKLTTKCHQIADCRIPGEPWVLVVHSEGRMQIADSRRQIAATTCVFSVKSMPNADFRFFCICLGGLRGSLQNADCNGADCNLHTEFFITRSHGSECARRLACWAGYASDEHTSEVAQQLGAIEKCLASTVINKSKAGSDSNLCTVASRHISAHGRPERCSSRIWQVWWSMHKCRSDAAAAMCTRCWRKVES